MALFDELKVIKPYPNQDKIEIIRQAVWGTKWTLEELQERGDISRLYCLYSITKIKIVKEKETEYHPVYKWIKYDISTNKNIWEEDITHSEEDVNTKKWELRNGKYVYNLDNLALFLYGGTPLYGSSIQSQFGKDYTSKNYWEIIDITDSATLDKEFFPFDRTRTEIDLDFSTGYTGFGVTDETTMKAYAALKKIVAMATYYCTALPYHLFQTNNKTPIIQFYERKEDINAFSPKILSNWYQIINDENYPSYAENFNINPITHIIELGTKAQIIRDLIRDFYNRAELISIQRPKLDYGEVSENTKEDFKETDDARFYQLIAKVNSAYDFEIPLQVPDPGERFYFLFNKFNQTWEQIEMVNDNICVITFETSGGNLVKPIQAERGTKIELSKPKKEGHSFCTWYYIDEQGKKITVQDEYTVTNSLTLYADWKIGEYIFTYTINKKSTSKSYPYGGTINIPEVPTKTGYTFIGWDPEIPSTMPGHDVTCIAQWSINQYTITFDTDGGSEIVPIKQDYDSAITAPTNPTKTGYTFDGWDETIPTKMPDKNTTIKAKWTINQYTITFDTYGGSEVPAIIQNYNTDVSVPKDPTKIGYTFDGWDKAVPSKMPAENITCVAQWKINQYTITFDTNGGSSIDPITQDYNTDIIKPTNPTKTGYTFNTWNNAIPNKMPAKNMTITASWNINQYTITFDTDGGRPEIDSKTQDYNTDIIKPSNPTKTGYTFIGWEPEIPSTMPDYDITCIAQWNHNIYTIEFDDANTSTIATYYGQSISEPPNPVKAGWTFIGWYEDQATEKYTFNTMPDKNIKLYAKWTQDYYTITFETNGGSPVSQIKAKYEAIIMEPTTTTTKEGYTFDGWYRDSKISEKENFPLYMPNENITLYAKWIVNQYTITFDTNGGSSIDPITQDYGSTITVPEDPVKENYTFIGWSPEIPLTMPAEDITCVAQWEEIA